MGEQGPLRKRSKLSPLQEFKLPLLSDSSSATEDDSASRRKKPRFKNPEPIPESLSETPSEETNRSTDGGKAGRIVKTRPSTSQSSSSRASSVSIGSSEWRTNQICGVIKCIQITNFMCHTNLQVDFNAHMNFVTGRNGSGKSAILTAIVTGLGGRAATMGRGGSLKHLVKSGNSSAQIAITLANNGVESFKPQLYGKEIVIERRIMVAGGGGYKIKNAQGKVVSDKKEELSRILEKFNIQIDNPVNILTQDVAKTFLVKLDFKDLYRLYFRATQLEKMSLDFRSIHDNYMNTREMLDHKRKLLKEQKREIDDLHEKIQAHRRLQADKEHLKKLGYEMSWALVRNCRKDIEIVTKAVEQKNEKVEEYYGRLEVSQEEESRIKEKMRETEEKIQKLEEETNRLEGIVDEKKRIFDREKHNLDQLEHIVSKAKSEVKRTEMMKKEVQNQIAEVNAKRGSRDKDRRDAEMLKREMEKLEQERKETERRVEEMLEGVRQAQEEYLSARTALNNAKQDGGQMQAYLREVEGELQETQRAGNNQLKRFGRNYENLLGLIEKNKAKFKERPRGPLGCDVKLKDKKWAVAVERAIGYILRSFACDNWADAKFLQQLMYQAGFDPTHRPNVIVSRYRYRKKKFRKECHDVRRNTPRCEYQTVLAYLDIKDPVVFNTIVDQCNPETVILIADKEEMNNYMRDRPAQGVRTSYSVEGDQCYPSPKYRFYSNTMKCQYLLAESADDSLRALTGQVNDLKQQIRRKATEIEQKREALSESEQARNWVGSQQKQEQSRLEQYREKMRKIAARIDRLALDEEEEDTKVLEMELEKADKDIQEAEEKQQAEIEKHQTCQEELKSHRAALKEAVAAVKKSGQSEIHEKEMQKYAKHRDECTRFMKQYKHKIEMYSTEKEKLEEELKHKETEVEGKLDTARALHPEEIVTDRDTKLIHKDIDRTEQRLKFAEQHVGDIDKVSAEYSVKHKAYKQATAEVESMQRLNQEIGHAMEIRQVGFRWMKTTIGFRMRNAFAHGMSTRDKGKNFKGKMWINDKQQKLILDVETRKPAEEENLNLIEKQERKLKKTMAEAEAKSLKNLSGGEKSFTMVAFILAMWEAMGFPFRAMDEFDVFLDSVNRDLATDLLVEFAREDSGIHTQFLYFTPLDLSKLEQQKGVDLNIFELTPPREPMFGRSSGSGTDAS